MLHSFHPRIASDWDSSVTVKTDVTPHRHGSSKNPFITEANRWIAFSDGRFKDATIRYHNVLRSLYLPFAQSERI